MTGHQPTPQQGLTASGEKSRSLPIGDLVRASGVSFLREVNAYDLKTMTDCLTEADRYCRSDDGGVAVLIASSPCVLHEKPATAGAVQAVRVTEECTGCEVCVSAFECPAIVWDEEAGKAGILRGACSDCGVCVEVCPMQAIVADGDVA